MQPLPHKSKHLKASFFAPASVEAYASGRSRRISVSPYAKIPAAAQTFGLMRRDSAAFGRRFRIRVSGRRSVATSEGCLRVNRCFSDSEGGTQGIDSTSRESSDCLRSDMHAVQARATAGRLYGRRSDEIALCRLSHRSLLRVLLRVLDCQPSKTSRAWRGCCGCSRSCVAAHTTTVENGHRLRLRGRGLAAATTQRFTHARNAKPEIPSPKSAAAITMASRPNSSGKSPSTHRRASPHRQERHAGTS